LSLVIVLAAKIFPGYASQLLTECTAFFFVFLFNWLFVRILVHKDPGPTSILVAGAALGLLVLTRPSYQYLLPFVVSVVFLWRAFGKRDGLRRGLGIGVALGAAALVVLFPWALRNYLELGQWTVGTGGPRVLVERLAYNTMTWPEWGVSFIYWLPDFGDNLARSVFAEDLWKRLTWYEPGSFYMMGRGEFFKTVYTKVAEQEPGNGLAFLIREYIWGDLGKHLAVSISLALRGQWVGNYVSFIGFLLLPFAILILYGRGRAGAFVVYCLPSYFMLGFYAFVSVNVVRYNEPLIAIFALSIALVIVRLVDLGLGRLRQTRKQT
jgi:4-amino-4-deoxy-L-arabinose transferase-like glycosyltransferase